LNRIAMNQRMTSFCLRAAVLQGSAALMRFFMSLMPDH
jgi:hypothetical protein